MKQEKHARKTWGNSRDIEYHWAKNNINLESERAPLQLIGMNKYIQASIAHKTMDHTKSVIALGRTKLLTDKGYSIMSPESSLQPISKHFILPHVPNKDFSSSNHQFSGDIRSFSGG